MKSASLIAATACLLLAGQAQAQVAAQSQDIAQAEIAAPWCDRAIQPPTPESVAVGEVFVPPEYAQQKARELLAAAPVVPLDAALAKQLGVPAQFVTAHSFLVRSGGFEQPFGDPGPGLEVYYDHGAGILQTSTHYRSVASDPINWAAVVVTSGDVYTVRSYCVSED